MYKQLLKLVCPEIKYNMYHTCMWEIRAANLITQWILQFGQTTCQHIYMNFNYKHPKQI